MNQQKLREKVRVLKALEGIKYKELAEDLLEMKVNLQLWVKVKKDWRDSDFMIKNFGYDKKEL